MKIERLNILISGHELSPFQGSECAEGWNIVKRLGEYHNITVLYAQVVRQIHINIKKILKHILN